MQLHPDRNPSADAAAQFHEVNIAYEILIGERKPPIYKRVNPFRQSPQKTRPPQETAEQRDARLRDERIRAARARWEQRMAKEQQEEQQYTLRYHAFRKTIGFKLAAFSFIIWGIVGCTNLIDHFLPARYHEYTVKKTTVADAGMIGVDLGSFVFKSETIVFLPAGETVIVEHSFLLGNPLNLHASSRFVNYHDHSVATSELDEGLISMPYGRVHLSHFIFLVLGLYFVFSRKPIPMVYVFFGLAVIVVNAYGIWFLAQLDNRLELFLTLFT